jgi:hypothetical protein
MHEARGSAPLAVPRGAARLVAPDGMLIAHNLLMP